MFQHLFRCLHLDITLTPRHACVFVLTANFFLSCVQETSDEITFDRLKEGDLGQLT